MIFMIQFIFRNARIVNAGNVGQSLSAQPLLPIGDASLGKSKFQLIIFQCYQLKLIDLYSWYHCNFWFCRYLFGSFFVSRSLYVYFC